MIIIFTANSVKLKDELMISDNNNNNKNNIYCKDKCSDGHKCLSDWLSCRLQQQYDSSIVCCIHFGQTQRPPAPQPQLKTNGQQLFAHQTHQSAAFAQQANCAAVTAANNRRHRQQQWPPMMPSSRTSSGIYRFFQNLFTGYSSGKSSSSSSSSPSLITIGNPWIVSVTAFESHICGGAVIASNVVLTAAHCFEPLFDPSVYSVRMIGGDGRLKVAVSRIILHDLYYRGESYHDIALVVTNTAVNSGGGGEADHIICLPSLHLSRNQLVGRRATVVGFGHKNNNNDYIGDGDRHRQQQSVCNWR
ncbi:transmembrane protease serine 11E-like [Oppia nitens]|uniref:transmembrane protease serine 11E-like n=1 Tax=Oppia nitens TaxID=1686743 RepID=UPI0023DADA39|nr:transmembrane protease serine 11E-like [Oppia nitens]